MGRIAMAKGWAVKKVKGGHVVTWAGDEWGMLPQSSEWCRDYAVRLAERYPEGGAWLTHQRQLRTRGGPWRYTWPDGDTEVVHVERLSDAKSVLRHRLRRKTLPAGITWNIEVDA
jgi:hypothetical protein